MKLKDGVYIDTSWNLHYPEGASLMDNFPEDLREVVNDHWTKFPPQHPLIVDIAGILFLILTALCLFTNFLIIYVFLTKAELRTPANMLMVNLAFSDSGIFATQGPLMFINAFSSDFWLYGPTLCKLYGFLGATFGTCSLVTLTFIGFDRYNVIVRGLGGPKITPLKAFLIITFIWAYSIGVCIPPYFGWGAYKLEGLFITCSYEYVTDDWNPKSFLLFSFFANFIIPLGFVAAFYAQIVKAVFFQEAAMKRAQTKLISAEKTAKRSDWEIEKKITKVAVMNVFIWFLAWGPYAIVTMIAAFGDKDLVTPLVSQLPAFFAKFASAFNPVLTAFSHPKCRNTIAEKFPCLGLTPYEIPDEEEEEVNKATSSNGNAAAS